MCLAHVQLASCAPTVTVTVTGATAYLSMTSTSPSSSCAPAVQFPNCPQNNLSVAIYQAQYYEVLCEGIPIGTEDLLDVNNEPSTYQLTDCVAQCVEYNVQPMQANTTCELAWLESTNSSSGVPFKRCWIYGGFTTMMDEVASWTDEYAVMISNATALQKLCNSSAGQSKRRARARVRDLFEQSSS